MLKYADFGLPATVFRSIGKVRFGCFQPGNLLAAAMPFCSRCTRYVSTGMRAIHNELLGSLGSGDTHPG